MVLFCIKLFPSKMPFIYCRAFLNIELFLGIKCLSSDKHYYHRSILIVDTFISHTHHFRTPGLSNLVHCKAFLMASLICCKALSQSVFIHPSVSLLSYTYSFSRAFPMTQPFLSQRFLIDLFLSQTHHYHQSHSNHTPFLAWGFSLSSILPMSEGFHLMFFHISYPLYCSAMIVRKGPRLILSCHKLILIIDIYPLSSAFYYKHWNHRAPYVKDPFASHSRDQNLGVG